MMYWSFLISLSIVEMARHLDWTRLFQCQVLSTRTYVVSNILYIMVVVYCDSFWEILFLLHCANATGRWLEGYAAQNNAVLMSSNAHPLRT